MICPFRKNRSVIKTENSFNMTTIDSFETFADCAYSGCPFYRYYKNDKSGVEIEGCVKVDRELSL